MTTELDYVCFNSLEGVLGYRGSASLPTVATYVRNEASGYRVSPMGLTGSVYRRVWMVRFHFWLVEEDRRGHSRVPLPILP